MRELIIVNFEEIYLKGANQKYFSDTLRKNLKHKLQAYKDLLHFSHVHGGSLFIELKRNPSNEEWQEIEEILKNTPGISQFYRVRTSPTDIQSIIETALEMAGEKIGNAGSFRITAKRLKKSLPYTSLELAQKTGAAIVKKFGTKVDLTNPDWNLHVKVRPDRALLYDRVVEGAGGLPAGTAGRAVALLSGGIDSPVAARMMINRGLELTALHFHSVPKTSPKSIEKVKKLAGILAKAQGNITLYLIPVLEIQENIARHTDSKLRLVLLRRIMLKIAEEIAAKENAKAIVTGDSLGQVASQTLENLIAIGAATSLPVLRPLIGLDKKFIIRSARKFQTYDISILPHDDACSLFTPKNPETKAHLSYVLSQCGKLSVEELVQNALAKTEILKIDPFSREPKQN